MQEKILTMEEIHEVTLDIMKKIDEVTEQLGLKYYMAYGSLIGAIRHQGFIPWDDDLDIMMMRDEYEKFLAFFMEHEAELYPYKLFCTQNTKDYPHMIARICNTEYQIEVENEIPCGMGVFVDVYPLDGMGDGGVQTARAVQKSHRLVDMDFWATRKHFEAPKKWYRIPDKWLRYCYAKFKGMGYFQRKLQEQGELFPLNESRYVGVITWGSDMMPFEKELFSETKRVAFENIYVTIPKEYDKILSMLYGDYMKLPPVEKQCPQHGYYAWKK